MRWLHRALDLGWGNCHAVVLLQDVIPRDRLAVDSDGWVCSMYGYAALWVGREFRRLEHLGTAVFVRDPDLAAGFDADVSPLDPEVPDAVQQLLPQVSGPSGVGKTTLARIIGRQIADDFCIEEYDSADKLTVEELRKVDNEITLYGWGRGGRAIIVNEAHGLRAPIVRQFLGLPERIPSHVVIIFTTTTDGLPVLLTAFIPRSRMPDQEESSGM